MYAERYLSEGTRAYSQFAIINEIDAAFQPNSDLESFDVPSIWIKASENSQLIRLHHQLAGNVAQLYRRGETQFLLPIHPATLPLLQQNEREAFHRLTPGPILTVTPTSSSRTVFVQTMDGHTDFPQHFLKLHFPGRISRFTRPLTHEDVTHQLWVSRYLQANAVPHLPDIGGGFALLGGPSSVGFILRSASPGGSIEQPLHILPGFALYGRDKHAHADPPMFVQLPRLFGEDALTFIVDRVVTPVIRLWVTTVIRLGVIPELHGQNTLFCFDSLRRTSFVCFRDSDIFVDQRLGRLASANVDGLPFELLGDDTQHSVEQLLSLTYDSFLIHHFLKPLADQATKWLGIDLEAIRRAAKSAFSAAGGGALPLGRRAYYFDSALPPEEQFELAEISIFEQWR